MKIYETMALLDPDFAGKDDEKAVEHVSAIIERTGGELIRVEKYAEQKLAYEIKNRKRGVYVLAAFRMDPGSVSDLTRAFKLDDYVLRDVVLDRTGLKLEQFFKTYSRDERHEAAAVVRGGRR